MKGETSMSSVKAALAKEGILTSLSSSMSSFVKTASGKGFSSQEIRKILNDLLSQELQGTSRTAGRSVSRDLTPMKSSLSAVNLNQLYSKYIDSVTMFSQETNPLDHLSEFGKPNSYSRSFSRGKKDAFTLEKTFKPGPGKYQPKSNYVRTSSPMHSLTKSKKTGLQFKMPYSPGPGSYKPLAKILAKRN